MKKLYVGCSLTHAPKDFIESVVNLKNELRKDFKVLDFVGLTGGSSRDVYEYDIEQCLKKSDVFLAITDYPSIGLGWELAVSANLRIPTLAVAHKDAKLTRLLLGAEEVFDSLEIYRYENLKEVPKRLLMNR